jgi:hypothetical protein
VDAETLRLVAARIAAQAVDWGLGALSAEKIHLRPFQAHSTYPLYLAEVAAGVGPSHRLVVKFAPIYGEHREGQAEYANLRTMWARTERSGHLHVPRPLAYWEDVNALVTEYRPGNRFSRRILSSASWFAPPGRRASLARTAVQCGEWLRAYHDATAHGEGPAIDERFLAIVRRDMARLPARGSLGRLGGAMRAVLEGAVEKLSGRMVPVAVRHGDFSPDNVHLDGEGICVFDLSHHQVAPVYSDIAFYLVALDTMNPYPRHPLFDRRVARGLEGPFLSGYFGADRARRQAEESAVLGAYMVKTLFTRCLRQRAVAASAGPFALAVFDGLWVGGHYRAPFTRAARRCAEGT